MLITGIRRENNILNITINDEPDENDETRLISCSSFLDHLMRSLRSIIDSMETRNFVNLDYFWRHILTQTTSFYNMLESCTKVQLQPIKYVCHSVAHGWLVCNFPSIFLFFKDRRF